MCYVAPQTPLLTTERMSVGKREDSWSREWWGGWSILAAPVTQRVGVPHGNTALWPPHVDGPTAVLCSPALRRVDPVADLSFVGRWHSLGFTQMLKSGGERGTLLSCELLDPRDPCGLEQGEIAQANPTEFTEVTRVNQLLHTLGGKS
jgi:hypothetical protein